MTSENISPKSEYQTKRLSLHSRVLGHAGALYALVDCNRKHLRSWMPWEEKTQSVEDSKQYLKSAIENWKQQNSFDFSVFESSSGKLIGSFGIHSIRWQHQSGEFGFWLGQEYQGRGYISECIELGEKIAAEIGLHRVVISCDRRNFRSQAVARRNGFKLEATLIDHMHDRGQYRDTLQFVKFINRQQEGEITHGLPAGYSIRVCNQAEHNAIVGKLKEVVYDDDTITVWQRDMMSEAETKKLKEMNQDYPRPYGLYLVLFYQEKLAGWCNGYQDTRESFSMADAAILPEHRGRSLYSALLDAALEILTEKGFQRIWSVHHMDNLPIIIAKLKRGFIINGTSINDAAGALVHLCYYTNPTRRKLMKFRIGSMRPDEEMKKLLKF